MKGVFEKKDNFGIIAFHSEGLRGFTPMFHPHCEIMLVKRGKVNVVINGAFKQVCEGEISFVFPYATHSYESASDAEVAVILFDPKLTYYEKMLMGHIPECPYIGNCQELFPLFMRVITHNKSKTKDSEKGARAYLNAIIAEISPHLTLKENDLVEIDISKKVLEYCAEHYTENITIKTVSDALFISTSYVSKVFSHKLRYGFREYINSLRIEKAKKMLSSTNKKIIDIMFECGFENQSSFNRVFIELVGRSPREYRKASD